MDIHPACKDLAFLLGTWRGEGHGEYPTIEEFDYHEEVTFGHVGKPFLAYTQKTKYALGGEPLHAEAGYLRAVGQNRVEFVIAQPAGIVEIHTGEVVGNRLEFDLELVRSSSSAKSVTDVARTFWLDDDGALNYRVAMAAVGQPLSHHLYSVLRRQPPSRTNGGDSGS